MRRHPTLLLFACVFFSNLVAGIFPPFQQVVDAATPWQAGFAKVDVTPTEPLRMAGYGSRDHPSEGVDSPLYVRAVALQHQASDDSSLPALLISVDTIGLPGEMTKSLATEIKQQHGLDRDRIVFSCTHTHSGPDLISELSNIFLSELSESEIEAGKRYKNRLYQSVLDAARIALGSMNEVELAYGSGSASFAANRRVLTNGKWTGFGVQADGVVDHSVPVLRISDESGTVKGVIFNYACHCTTVGGDYYRINADWAGYATTSLERKHPGAVALCTIGCGADANPEPRGNVDFSKRHGRVLAEEIQRVLGGELKRIDRSLTTKYDYAALSFDRPTKDELTRRVKDPSTRAQVKRHAEQFLKVLEERRRLPATYPVPIQAWQFGDQLTMIFIGGEVVVDYALRLKKELNHSALWVTAYANDVLGYIASEKMIHEEGYEYFLSAIFYGLPGPWASGTEDLLIERIKSLLQSKGRAKPLPPKKALGSFELTEGFEIELVASEPLVKDPINMAFDKSGHLWVVEMGDYPEGQNGGQIKKLIDDDGDGKYDRSQVFMKSLSFPTGVLPWRDGILVSCAPNIYFAKDTDGDGQADQVDTLYSGFRLANPQHRVNGFAYGLDHSLHLACGDNLKTIKSERTGQTVDASGHDIQIWPDDGGIAVTSGRTQWVRSRDDWGHWFGNDNSRPMFQYPIDERYLDRNPHVRYSGNQQSLFRPAIAPSVFPATKADERFNDLFAANRFTSVCSSIFARSATYQVDQREAVFICEPVHNLVHRSVVEPAGATYRAERGKDETASEFLVSTDPWFRPTRVCVGPDDHLYVVDMYRAVIEHPEWIPENWQSQIDVNAGAQYGRIYRVKSKSDSGSNDLEPEDLGSLSVQRLVDELTSHCGSRRDLAQQLIVEQELNDKALLKLKRLSIDASQPLGRIHAMWILQLKGELSAEVLAAALEGDHVGTILVAIQLAEDKLDEQTSLLKSVVARSSHPDPRVRLRVALALGNSRHASAGKALSQLVKEGPDRWIADAIVSSAAPHAQAILDECLADAQTKIDPNLIARLIQTAESNGIDVANRYQDLFKTDSKNATSTIRLAASFAQAYRSRPSDRMTELLRPIHAIAKAVATQESEPEANRCEALQLIGIGIQSEGEEQSFLLDLISPRIPTEVQCTAIERLYRLGNQQSCRQLLSKWPAMSKQVRDRCISRILERSPWTVELLNALEANQVKLSDLTMAAQQQLVHVGNQSMKVRALRLTRRNRNTNKSRVIDQYAKFLGGERSHSRGAAIFKKHCAVCHVANENDKTIGPSLQNLTDRKDRSLLTAILDPNQAVDPKFQSYAILTTEDRVLVGAIEAESGNSLTIAKADGKRSIVLREEIEELKNTGVSLMPEGFENSISTEQMKDLIAYLQNPNPSSEN